MLRDYRLNDEVSDFHRNEGGYGAEQHFCNFTFEMVPSAKRHDSSLAAIMRASPGNSA
jgi:hypothetical protein